MPANAASSKPTGYLVCNLQTDGWKLYSTKQEAQSVTRRWPQLQMFPVWGEFEVDQSFLRFARWAVAA